MNEHTLETEHFRQYQNGGQIEIHCTAQARIFQAEINTAEVKNGKLHIHTHWFAKGEPYPIPTEFFEELSVPSEFMLFDLAGCDAYYADAGRLHLELPTLDMKLTFFPPGDPHSISRHEVSVTHVV